MKKGHVKVSLVNVWSDYNRGDAAIVLATIGMLDDLFDNCSIDLHNVVFGAKCLDKYRDTHFEHFREYKIFPALFPSLVERKNKLVISNISRLFYLGRSIFIMLLGIVHPSYASILLNSDEKDAFNSILRSDIVISKGGSYLLGNSWKDVIQLSMVMFPLVLAKTLRCNNVILLGVSIGPAKSKIASGLMKLLFKYVDKIVVREYESFDVCKRLKVPSQKLFVVPDMAFLMSKEPNKIPRPLFLDGYEKPLIGVTARPWKFDDVKNKNKDQLQMNYLNSILITLNKIQEKYGGTILLVPQVVGPNVDGSDMSALEYLRKNLIDRNVLFIKKNNSVKDLLSIYKNIDLLIGTRLHSIILAYGTPSVMIGYQGNKSLGTAKLTGTEKFHININSITPGKLFVVCDLVLSDASAFKVQKNKLFDRFEKLGDIINSSFGVSIS